MINLVTAKDEDRSGVGTERRHMVSTHVTTEEFLNHPEAAVDNRCSSITSTAKLISIYLMN